MIVRCDVVPKCETYWSERWRDLRSASPAAGSKSVNFGSVSNARRIRSRTGSCPSFIASHLPIQAVDLGHEGLQIRPKPEDVGAHGRFSDAERVSDLSICHLAE